MNNKSQGQRFDNIDLLKAISIFFVILIHSYGLYYMFWENREAISYVNYFLRAVLSTSVPLFFTCSGFLLFSKKLELKTHVKKTLHYILLTYVWGVISIIFWMLLNNVHVSVDKIIELYLDKESGILNHLWFMGALVRIYVLFPILKYATDRYKSTLAYFLCSSIIFLILNKGINVLVINPTEGLLGTLSAFNPFNGMFDWAFVYFSIGGVISLYWAKINELFIRYRKQINLVATLLLIVSNILLFACGVFLTYYTGEHWDVVWDGYNTIFTFISVISIFALSLNYRVEKANWMNALIKKVSANTLGIYFIHMIIINIMGMSIELVYWARRFDTFILKALLILAISLGIAEIIKKIPFVRRLVK